MKKIAKSSIVAAMIGLTAVGLPASYAGAQTAEPVPIPVWALRDVISSVSVSPDGKHILVLKTETREGDYLVEIYATDDMSKPLRRLAADPMEITSARWVSDNHIFGGAWQVVRKSVKGPEEDVREYKGYIYNLKTNKFSQTSENFNLVGTLPNEPTKILVSGGSPGGEGLGVDPDSVFRARSYYKLDLETGTSTLVMRGQRKYSGITFDVNGNPRYTTSYEAPSQEEVQYYRLPGDSEWKEFGERYDLNKQENLYRVLGGIEGVAGFDPDNPAIAYVIDNRDDDKAALWEFNFQTGEFGKKLFQAEGADVMGIQTSSIPGNEKLVAAVYPGAKYERHWFDEEEKALYEALEKQIPHAHQVRISSRSRDGNTMIVQNSGPRDPGSFWLIKDGKRAKLGSRNPLLKPEQLSDVEFIKYPARDGKIIPAYVTKPKGEGPFPLIVLPHGGPHVNEVIGYDEWGQLLANNGYMVLQPQYRMSTGWGQDHFDSAYGQHGLAMQDDKDDGALYLVKQGLVDPDRIAMFGWSYGGYAALVAASRDPNIYQCAIAGAAVADPAKVYQMRSNPYSPKALDEWAKRRGMIGINPINEVDKVNISVLMVHGDVDRRVLYFNLKDYKAAMEKAAGSQGRVTIGEGPSDSSSGAASPQLQQANYQPRIKYVTLKGADHFYSTLMYNHQEQFFTEMLSFLKNDCGPGGL